MSRCTWLIALTLLHACGDEATPRASESQTVGPEALTQAASRGPIELPPVPRIASTTYELDSLPIRLESNAESCWIAAGSAAEAVRVDLDLTPPCYALRWQGEVDLPSPDVSDGVPVGQPGNVAAWRYTEPVPFTVFAVVGDPIPEDSGLRKSRKYKQVAGRQPPCVSSIQGVLVKQGRFSTRTPLARRGIFCPDTVPPQPTYWILSHD
jgi:hypothetical protein